MSKDIYTLFMKVVTMDRRNLLIAGGLIGGIVVLLVIGAFIIMPGVAEILEDKDIVKLKMENIMKKYFT